MTLDLHLALLAAVFQLALRDAQHGQDLQHAAAVEYLRETDPIG